MEGVRKLFNVPRLDDLNDRPQKGLYYRGEKDLYYRGEIEAIHRPCVAIVGSRACSSYGRSVARMLGRNFAENNVTVISGLARGIDAEAHRGALDVGGRTVAVFGCGIDTIYPSAHKELAERILFHNGMHVSEYAPDAPPAPWRFPARNRIIAGLAHVTIVVEARERSGALICADFALECRRPVYAVPGEIFSENSVGTNRLISNGYASVLTGISAGVKEIVDIVQYCS